MTTLDTVPTGGVCKVSAHRSDGILHRRFLDLGIICGTEIRTLFKSPHGDPKAYLIRGAVIALRNADASKIAVEII